MWPMLLDMSQSECKKALRTLELEAYSIVVSTFRAQGDLTSKKQEILKDLQAILKISPDRHKAELRRASNDEKLFTIAKRLSRGECISSEWIKQSKRLVPLLPTLNTNNSRIYYRILADHIVSKSQPVLNLYPSSNTDKNDTTDSDTAAETVDFDDYRIKPIRDEENLVHLANGYAVNSKNVIVENYQPSEFVKRHDEKSDNPKHENNDSFLKSLIKRHLKQKEEEKQRLEAEKQRKQAEETLSDNQLSNRTADPAPSISHIKNITLQPVESSPNKFPKQITQQQHIQCLTPTVQPIPVLSLTTVPQQIIISSQQLTENNYTELDKLKKSISNLKDSQALKPPSSSSTTAQVIKLTSNTQPSYPSSPSSSINSNIIQTSPTIASNRQYIQNSIVKLTPTQINLNNTSANTSISSPTTPTNSSNSELHLKHIVLPKSNQKLIIVPNANSPSSGTNSHNGHYLTTSSPSQQLQKLILLKSNTKTINNKITDDDLNVNNSNENTYMNTKSLKILSGSPILTMHHNQTNQPNSGSSQIFKLTISNNSSANNNINNNNSNNLKQNSIISNIKTNGLNIASSESNDSIPDTSVSTSPLTTTSSGIINLLKRKFSSTVEQQKNSGSLPSSSSAPSLSSSENGSLSTTSSSLSNCCENNIKLIKDMLQNLNKASGDELSTDSNSILNSPNISVVKNQNINKIKILSSKPQVVNASSGSNNEVLKVLCEKVKEKLEKNSYECIDDMNNDFKLINDKYFSSNATVGANISASTSSSSSSSSTSSTSNGLVDKLTYFKLESTDSMNSSSSHLSSNSSVGSDDDLNHGSSSSCKRIRLFDTIITTSTSNHIVSDKSVTSIGEDETPKIKITLS